MAYILDPTDAESNHNKVTSMAIVGHTTQTESRIWVRTFTPGQWCLVVKDTPFVGDFTQLAGLQVKEYLASIEEDVAFCQTVNISGATDNTFTFDVTELKPDTRYYYGIISELSDVNNLPRRMELGSNNEHYFKTLKVNPDKLVFGFSSCHDPFSTQGHSIGAWPIFYDVLQDRDAAFCIGGGDQMYVDTNNKKDMYSIWEWLSQYKNDIIAAYRRDNNVAQGGGKATVADGVGLDEQRVKSYFAQLYRKYYRIYWNFYPQKKVYQQFPQYMIWDDHEIMDGWGAYSRDERKMLLNKFWQNDDEETNDRLIELMFSAAKQVYAEYQHSHNPQTNITAQLVDDEAKNALLQWDYGFVSNTVAFYVLDMRGHHDFERAEQGTALLGEQQMSRFTDWLQGLRNKEVSAVFIISPVPVVHWNGLVMNLEIIPGMKDDLRDEWDHQSNHLERNKLLDHVLAYSDSTEVKVTFLSGDVHSASVFEIQDSSTFSSQTAKQKKKSTQAPVLSARYARAKVFNATSSAISRKPAPGALEMMIEENGKMRGRDNTRVKRRYAMSGRNNFMMVSVDLKSAAKTVAVELYWPAGDDNEMSHVKIKLD